MNATVGAWEAIRNSGCKSIVKAGFWFLKVVEYLKGRK